LLERYLAGQVARGAVTGSLLHVLTLPDEEYLSDLLYDDFLELEIIHALSLEEGTRYDFERDGRRRFEEVVRIMLQKLQNSRSEPSEDESNV